MSNYLINENGKFKSLSAIVVSSGITDGNKLIALNNEGRLDSSLLVGSSFELHWDNILNKPNVTIEDIESAVNEIHTHINKTILDNITEPFTTLLKTSYDSAVSNNHTHINKTILDNITVAFTTELESKIHIHNNKNILDNITEPFTIELKNTYTSVVNDSHFHNNKDILDNITEAFTLTLKSSYDDTVIKTHTHSNKNILDNITESFTTLLKTAYDDVVTKAHNHTDIYSLNLITKDINGNPLWDNEPWPSSSALGDMTKSIYDSNNDGKVDMANVADIVDWTGIQNKPSTYTPTTHIHNTSDITGLISHINTMNDLLINAMLKDDYDSNQNGIVDVAEVANAVNWNNVTNKPLSFTPTTHSHTFFWNVTLDSSSWLGTGPYTILVNATNVTITDKPIINLNTDVVSFNDIVLYKNNYNYIYRIETLNNQFKFYATEQPTINLNINVLVIR